MPFLTPIRTTMSRLEMTHVPVGTLVGQCIALAGAVGLGWLSLRAANMPDAIRWLLRVFSVLLGISFLTGVWKAYIVSDVTIDRVSRRMTLVFRPLFRFGERFSPPLRTEYDIENVAQVVFRTVRVHFRDGNKRKMTSYHSLRLVMREGEEISLLHRDYSFPLVGGTAMGTALAEFLGVDFRREIVD